MDRKRTIEVVESGLLVTLFIAAITLPLIGLTFRWHVMTEQEENRRLTSFPSLAANKEALITFPEKFTAYFNDNFGFRPILIHLQALAILKLFSISASPQVILGKDGWLFFGAEYSDSGKHLVAPYTKEQLENWKLLLEGRRDWLARRGIRYVFTIFPRKEVIYPEFLPDSFKPQEESRFDQLYAYLKQHSDVDISDLRPALLEAKTRHQIYYKTDSHWNYYGGLSGYQSVINEVRKWFPQLQRVSESDCEAFTQRREGDLIRLLGLSSYLEEDEAVLRIREPGFRFIGDKTITVSAKPVIARLSERNESDLPRTVMFGDSAFTWMDPFFRQNFSRLVFVWLPRLDPALIKAEHPDIVIQEMAEMHLADIPLADLAEIDDLESGGKGKLAFPFTVDLDQGR